MNFNGTCAVIKAKGSTWNFYTRTGTLQVQGRSCDKIRKYLLRSFNIDEKAAVFNSNEVSFEVESTFAEEDKSRDQDGADEYDDNFDSKNDNVEDLSFFHMEIKELWKSIDSTRINSSSSAVIISSEKL